MMASGMNGQSFTFHGYLPIEKGEKSSIKNLEKISLEKNLKFLLKTYRNNKMLEDILQALHPETYLCIATDITLPTEYIKKESICLKKRKRSAQ
jgi:16S rRNA (cytidine1402-2'-O)-methyltransferase